MKYTIKLRGVPTPRPRCSKWGVYTPVPYGKYLEALTKAIEELEIPIEDYVMLNVTFYFKYPKSTPKKDLVDLQPHRKKPDGDNLLKGLQDALVYAKVLVDDGQLCCANACKCYTTDEDRIEFELSVAS